MIVLIRFNLNNVVDSFSQHLQIPEFTMFGISLVLATLLATQGIGVSLPFPATL